MRVLGIETSCDETAAAVVEGGFTVRAHVISSQADLHATFGGVVPEIASRRHVEVITAVVEEALAKAGTSLEEIEGIAVTNRPGLIGSLLVGVSMAKGLAFGRGLPLVGVHHLEGHIFASFVAAGGPVVPAVALIASGGHTELFYVRAPHDYQVMGRRLDDAAGEAFDKGARAVGLEAGGGAALDQLARQGNPQAVPFPRARTDHPLDFSFSGLKTALLRFLETDGGRTPVADVAASYQQAIVDVLVEHALQAAHAAEVDAVLVGGGVAANSRLQAQLRTVATARNLRVAFPPPDLCTDNAAMIAAAGHSLLERGVRHGFDLETKAREPLTTATFAPACQVEVG
ncbi:MAG: tRNA (adenosine(37)-N6)-threonylcarbamoyltransferase complex transferase subunit TsaD [Armatimonadetes bacterium]|nr:tRNA (adenosine(37)-N6)-threonylcarbamoyltransferase complex transferase subunit TsaD [Armatimonadota bacterium]